MMTKRKEKQIYSSTEVHLSALKLCFVDMTVMGDEKSNVIECLLGQCQYCLFVLFKESQLK